MATNQNVELLAPAGNWESLETVVAAGADAVYLGGKKHNMRMLRPGFNFSEEELKSAVGFAHDKNVNIYITVNNLQSDEELNEMESYLEFLAKISPDALIVQDLGVIKLVKQLGINIPLHSSVMVNVHNKGMIDFLRDEGVERFIIGRELSFEQARLMARETGVELEYFIHGDMCFSQSGQCYLSGMLFGNSSNRGRCLKPCRWPYELAKMDGRNLDRLDVRVNEPYFLAVKDMCVYRIIPQLIQSGIVSFKVEGRMKPPAQLHPIISAYRQAIDAYLEDPTGYQINENNFNMLYNKRVRDFSTCFALKNPGADGIGYSGEREPKFFSEAGLEKDIDFEDNILSGMEKNIGEELSVPELAVKVINLEQLKMALKAGVDRIYLGGEVPAGQKPVGKEILAEASCMVAETEAELVFATPRITMPDEMNEYINLIKDLAGEKLGGILAGNLGMIDMINKLTDIPVFADFGVNAFNSRAMELLRVKGVKQVTVQLESSLVQAVKLASKTELPLEIIGHGYLPFMISDHCLLAELLTDCLPEGQCSTICKDGKYGLVNKKGAFYRVMADQYCRNHLYLSKELILLPYLEQLFESNFSSFRIEAQLYDPEKVGQVVAVYKQAFTGMAEPGYRERLKDLWLELLKLSDNGYTLAAYENGVLESGS